MNNLRHAILAVTLACARSPQGPAANGPPPADAGRAADAAAVAAAAVDSGPGPKREDAKMASSLERVRSWASAQKMEAIPWREVTVVGLEFFTVGGARDTKKFGVALVEGADKPLVGKDALRAAFDRGVSDPANMARLTTFLLASDSEPLTPPIKASGVPKAELALAYAPRVKDGYLEFWWHNPRVGSLVFGRLALDTLDFTTETASEIVENAKDAIQRATEDLAADSDTLNLTGVETLAAACNDPRAPKLLAQTLAGHRLGEVRAAAAAAMASCRDKGTVAALIKGLKDKDPPVRAASADALGVIADPSAKAALKKATEDPDDDVKGAAERALEALGKE